MNLVRTCAAICTILLLAPGLAQARIRPTFQDATVAERAELIVIGHLDRDSIKYVPHDTSPDSGRSWEHHATLVITDILKGASKEKRIPIVIHYGLDIAIGRLWPKHAEPGKPAAPDADAPVAIYDTGNSSISFEPVLKNAADDNVWFLRRSGQRHDGADAGPLGIVDPEDVAPLQFRDFFAALLACDADSQLDLIMAGPDEALVARALRHLSAGHRATDVPRIARLLDSSSRNVRTLAVQALAEVGDLSTVPLMRNALGHDDPQARAIACAFLCRFHDVQSLPAIAETLRKLDSLHRARVLRQLPRMESPAVIDLLLENLDERLDADANSLAAWQASTAAAEALFFQTAIEFPADTVQARKLWDKLKHLPPEALLRQLVRQKIEALTTPGDYEARWQAYVTLGRLTNQHHGSYNAFHSDSGDAAIERTQAQNLWRQWAEQNLTAARNQWIFDGFAQSGITLPQPINAEGIDLLIDVLRFYGKTPEQGPAIKRPHWKHGWSKGNFHRYNANRLLEQYTGHSIGFSPYHYDRMVRAVDDAADAWAAWWKENRDRVTLQPLPEEKPLTPQQFAAIPAVPVRSPPLTVTIRAKNEAHVFKGPQTFIIIVEVKNTSGQELLVARRPGSLDYSCSIVTGTSPPAGPAVAGEDAYVSLKPGEAITWEQPDSPDVNAWASPPAPLERLQYTLTYSSAGSQFGLRAWRGKLLSNVITCRILPPL